VHWREKLQGLNQALAWAFTRNTVPPTKLVTVEVGQTQAKQNIPGLTGFHAIVTVNNSRPTRIGFPPMIPAPVKDPNTVYTSLKSLIWARLPKSLRQKNAVVTFDEGIYFEAKRIQRAITPELDSEIVQLGGFYRAKNFEFPRCYWQAHDRIRC